MTIPNHSSDYARALKMFAVQTFVLAATGLCVVLDLRFFRNMNENGIVEMTQLALLEFSAFAFFVNARANRELRMPLSIIGAILVSAIIRENDSPLDVLLFHGAWKFICLPIWIAVAVAVILNFRKTVAQCAAFSRTASFHYVLLGLLVIGGFAQAVSYKGIWNDLLDGVRMRTIKNIVQESFEMLGYAIMLFGAVAIDMERPRKPAAAVERK